MVLYNVVYVQCNNGFKSLNTYICRD